MKTKDELQKEALEAFQRLYPNSTSGDLQTFVLGMKAQEEIQKMMEKLILGNE